MNKWLIKIDIFQEYTGYITIAASAVEQIDQHTILADGVKIYFGDDDVHIGSGIEGIERI